MNIDAIKITSALSVPLPAEQVQEIFSTAKRLDEKHQKAEPLKPRPGTSRESASSTLVLPAPFWPVRATSGREVSIRKVG